MLSAWYIVASIGMDKLEDEAMTNGDAIAEAAREASLEAILEGAQQVLNAHTALQRALQAGWLTLAHARYVMGSARVSQLQHPRSATQATCRLRVLCEGEATAAIPREKYEERQEASNQQPSVDAAEDEKEGDGSVHHLRFSMFSVCGACGAVHDQGSEGTMGESIDRDVHQRVPCLARGEDGAGQKLGRISDKLDSIRLFGAFVPPSVRKAQQEFTEALEAIVGLANANEALKSALRTPQVVFISLTSVSDNN